MGQLIASRIKDAVKGLFSGLDATDVALLLDLELRPKVRAHVTDGGTAGTAQTETHVWRNDTATNYLVKGAKVALPVALTAGDTNYASVLLARRDNAGLNSVSVASINTAITVAPFSGNITAFLPVALTLSGTSANLVVGPGQVLTIAVTKTGTGLAIAAATSQAIVEVILEPID